MNKQINRFGITWVNSSYIAGIFGICRQAAWQQIKADHFGEHWITRGSYYVKKSEVIKHLPKEARAFM